MRPDLLTSPLFLVSLTTLVVNDVVLKRLAPGFLTGKFSDFAGLFAFTLFWYALVPRRRVVGAVVAVAFVIWKLPLAQSAIDLWNAYAPFRIGRTVDVTDLFALVMIPLALVYAQSRKAAPRGRMATVPIILASVIAFGATSYRTVREYKTVYVFDGSPAAFVAAVKEHGIDAWPTDTGTGGGELGYQLDIPADICFDEVDAYVTLSERDGATQVRLREMVHRCPEQRRDKEQMQRAFESAVAEPLKLKKR